MSDAGADIVERLRAWENDETDEAAELIEGLRENSHLAVKAITAYTEACIDLSKRLDAERTETGALRVSLQSLVDAIAADNRKQFDAALARAVALLTGDETPDG